MQLYRGHHEGDDCKFPWIGHYMPYPADLRAELAVWLATEDGYVVVNDATREQYASKAEVLLDKVRDWLIGTTPQGIRLDNAHRSHVAYVTYLLGGGEPNQLDAVIDSYSKQQEIYPAEHEQED